MCVLGVNFQQYHPLPQPCANQSGQSIWAMCQPPWANAAGGYSEQLMNIAYCSWPTTTAIVCVYISSVSTTELRQHPAVANQLSIQLPELDYDRWVPGWIIWTPPGQRLCGSLLACSSHVNKLHGVLRWLPGLIFSCMTDHCVHVPHMDTNSMVTSGGCLD